MRGNLDKALTNTETMYSNLVDIANNIVQEYTKDIDPLISQALSNVEKLTNDNIRVLLLKLSLMAYSFSELKDKSALKAQCAEILRKEAYSIKFNEIEGSVASKDSVATIETSDEILSEAVYELVASLFKTKIDTIFRVVDTLKTVLTSRLSEAKLTTGITVGE